MVNSVLDTSDKTAHNSIVPHIAVLSTSLNHGYPLLIVG